MNCKPAKGHLQYITFSLISFNQKLCYLSTTRLVSVFFRQVLKHLHLISSEITALLLITAVIKCHLNCLISCLTFIHSHQMIRSVLCVILV